MLMIAWQWPAVSLALLVTACTSYPPPLAPARGQTAVQQEADAKDCDHQVHSAARSMTVGAFTAWSTEERDKYVACMQGKGYTPAK
jgi:HPt (histidine-containing phosphotransfer) domain-containing protein